MAKKKNRKKEYKLGLKRAGVIATAGAVVEKVAKPVAVAKKAVAVGDFDSFVAELEGVSAARLQTFFDEGIQSVADFANYTEKELLALKGIGPATIKQLQEIGVSFKD